MIETYHAGVGSKAHRRIGAGTTTPAACTRQTKTEAVGHTKQAEGKIAELRTSLWNVLSNQKTADRAAVREWRQWPLGIFFSWYQQRQVCL